ncbi:hypothetical protein WMF18_04825 [Sorangium sp. So ce315]|uniref:hypothetical protein n=1 Tax=Sorangium sp. So ce315 TaxID=3133299 RepID=UPI003F63807A
MNRSRLVADVLLLAGHLFALGCSAPKPEPEIASSASHLRVGMEAGAHRGAGALRVLAASLAAAAAGSPGCARRSPDGRIEASLWFAYGGKNRDVLRSLIDRSHREQGRHRLEAVYQGANFPGVRPGFARWALPRQSSDLDREGLVSPPASSARRARSLDPSP